MASNPGDCELERLKATAGPSTTAAYAAFAQDDSIFVGMKSVIRSTAEYGYCQLLNRPAHQERLYYTYIVASRSHTVYIGMTGNLHLRVFQHKQKTFEGFSADYNCNRLVWFERFMSPGTAIAREKQLKGWIRAKKIALIEKMNPVWVDLSDGWYVVDPSRRDAGTRTTAGPSTTAAGATFAQDDKGL